MEKRTRSLLGAGLCAVCGVGLLLVGSTLMGVLACLGGTGMFVYTLSQSS